MSISGLHITMVSGLVFALAHACWRRRPGLTLRLPARKAAVVFGLAAALLYTLLSGYAVPAQRTLYMLAVVAAALWAGISLPISSVLAGALLLVLLVDPWAVLSPGFWLSFGAVAIILFVSSNRAGKAHWLVSWAKVQWAVTLALVPLLLAMFQQVSLVSPVANAFAIPLISLGVVPLTLAGLALPFDLGLQIAHRLMAGCMLALEFLSALPDAVWQQHAPPPWAIACALAGAVWLLLPRGTPARSLGAIAMLPLFAVTPTLPAQGDMRVTVLDVGQGLSVVVQTRDHALLFDTGPPFGPGADSGNRIVVPYLRASGVRRLDGMIVSHDDNDHSGGAVSVLQAMPVDWLMSSLTDFDPLPLQIDEAVTCYRGQNWEWDGVKFEILHPTRASYGDPRIKDNNRSCVLKVTAAAGSILLPADIERYAEEILLAQARPDIRSDILVSPHQGSRTSSTADFIAAVGARAVVIPAGYRNRFGHPHAEVVDRYRHAGIDIYRTDLDGAVIVNFTAQAGIRMEGYRDRFRRYWYDVPAVPRKSRESEVESLSEAPVSSPKNALQVQ
jgi:competence protein ComEC